MKRKKLNLKKIFQTCLWIIPLGVIGNLVFTVLNSGGEMSRILNRFNWIYLAGAVVLGLVPWLTNTLRINNWALFLNADCKVKDCFCMVLGAELGGALSPTAMGGGYVKLGMLVDKGLTPGQAFSIMTMGSLEDYCFFGLAIPFSLFLYPTGHLFSGESMGGLFQRFSFFNGTMAFLILIVVVAAFLFRSVVKEKLIPKMIKAWRDFCRVFSMVGEKGKYVFFINFLLASFQWICRYSVITVLLACFGIAIEPVQVFLYQWLVFTLTSFIPTPGGSGGAETAFFFVFKTLVPHDVLALATVGWRFLTYYLQLTLGAFIFSLLYYQLLSKKKGSYEENSIGANLKVKKLFF